MKNKGLAYIILGIMLIGLASAVTNLDIPLPSSLGDSYGTFKVGEDIILLQTCTNETAFCDQCNITSLKYDGDVLVTINLEMTQHTALFNRTIPASNIQYVGHYTVTGFCTAGEIYSPWAYDFEVNLSGFTITTAQTYIYIIGIVSLILLILGIYILKEHLPSQDTKDEEGNILQISQLKHLRLVLWACMWSLCLAIIFIVMNLSLHYLDNAMIGDLFFAIYQIMFWMTIVMLPAYFIYIIWRLFKDKEMQDMINRGVGFKTP